MSHQLPQHGCTKLTEYDNNSKLAKRDDSSKPVKYIRTPYSKKIVDAIEYCETRLSRAIRRQIANDNYCTLAEVRRWRDLLNLAKQGTNISEFLIKKNYKNPDRRRLENEIKQEKLREQMYAEYAQAYKEHLDNKSV